MFRLEEGAAELQSAVNMAERNYVIQVNDFLNFDVLTNDGERLVDPDFELGRGMVQNPGQRNQGNNQNANGYLVQADSLAKFPMIGKVNLVGLTIDEAEGILENQYNQFYKDVFVRLRFTNKRVVMLGANGGQVIPLINQNMTLAEILALSGGVGFGSKAHNIRIIRGPLTQPAVFEINLNTIEGMRKTIIPIVPGDIIYVEPWRRPFFEVLGDIAPVLSATTSIIAFVVLINNIQL